MAGILEGIVKGISGFMPQDDPDVKIFNAQNELKDIKEKIEAAYARLGRQVFETDGVELYPELKAELERLNLEKSAAIEQVQKAKDEKVAAERAAAEEAARRDAEDAACICPNCGNRNPQGTNFCQECGTKLAAPISAGKRFCPNCGTVVALENYFCGSCGTKME